MPRGVTIDKKHFDQNERDRERERNCFLFYFTWFIIGREGSIWIWCVILYALSPPAPTCHREFTLPSVTPSVPDPVTKYPIIHKIKVWKGVGLRGLLHPSVVIRMVLRRHLLIIVNDSRSIYQIIEIFKNLYICIYLHTHVRSQVLISNKAKKKKVRN